MVNQSWSMDFKVVYYICYCKNLFVQKTQRKKYVFVEGCIGLPLSPKFVKG
jgi:hypothetical protein